MISQQENCSPATGRMLLDSNAAYAVDRVARFHHSFLYTNFRQILGRYSFRSWHCAPYKCLHYYAALLPRRGPHIALHSVCPSVCLSICPSVPLSSVTSRHLANYNDTYFSLRAEGRISYGHLGRTNSCYYYYYRFIIDTRHWDGYRSLFRQPVSAIIPTVVFQTIANSVTLP